MRTNSRLVAALLSLAVAGCGGGGGSSSPAPVAGAASPAPSPAPGPSPSPSPAPAPAGFSVVSTTPADGTTAVARSSPIAFTLNDAPLASTLPATQPNSVQLLTPEGVNLVSGVTVSGDTVSIANSGLALAGNTTYNVQLASTISSTGGKTLGSPFSWSFTTAGETWAMPGSNISTFHGTPIQTLDLATDGAANVFASWIDNGSSGDFIAVQMFNPLTNSWNSTATNVFTTVSSNLGSINLSSMPGGEPVLTWVGSMDQSGDLALYLSTFQLTGPGTGSWSTPVITPIDPGSYTPTGVTQISTAHTLTVAAHMYQHSGPTPDFGLFIGQYDEVAKTWGAVNKITTVDPFVTSLGSYLASAVDAAGNITVAYVDGPAGNEHVLTTTQTGGAGSWSQPQQIDTLASGDIDYVVLAAGVGGTTLSWMQTSAGAQPTIEAARLNTGSSSWTAPQQLDDGSSPTGAMIPSIAIDNAGYVDISYAQPSTGNTVAATDGVFLVRFNPTTSTWTNPIRMSAAGVGADSNPAAIAVDNAGNVQLLYRVGHGIAPAIYYVSTGSVFDPGIIDNPNGAAFGFNETPSLVVGPDNIATGVWVDGETSGTFIRADRKQ